MLSLFPNLLNYWLVAPVILRAALGLALVHEAYSARREQKVLALAKLLAGGLLIIGLATQAATLVGAIICLYELWRQGTNDRLLLKLAIAVSLLFLGPGFLALDWPL
ncbi:MAG: hypothetical protein HYT47_00245 [Candidatus Vogelbacteria bacterium]|nr:hypothetical protein [Candidatus Vogelbacteria bacterium]